MITFLDSHSTTKLDFKKKPQNLIFINVLCSKLDETNTVLNKLEGGGI